MPRFLLKRMNMRPLGECRIVVSREALYLRPTTFNLLPIGAIHGAIGATLGLVAGSSYDAIFKAATANGAYTCDLADLPEGIRMDKEWPLLKKTGPVVVVPRGAAVLRHPKFSNELHLIFGNEKLRLVYLIFTAGKLFSFLRENGWEIT